jgi:hypothetical protein
MAWKDAPSARDHTTASIRLLRFIARIETTVANIPITRKSIIDASGVGYMSSQVATMTTDIAAPNCPPG